MATVKTYVANMKPVARQIAVKYGSSGDEKTLRVAVITMLTMLAVVIKLLVDKGVVTDAELQTAFGQTGNDGYDEEPDQAPPM